MGRTRAGARCGKAPEGKSENSARDSGRKSRERAREPRLASFSPKAFDTLLFSRVRLCPQCDELPYITKDFSRSTRNAPVSSGQTGYLRNDCYIYVKTGGEREEGGGGERKEE